MKYLKVTNVPLKIWEDPKYNPINGQINWEACGFNIIQVTATAIQYTELAGDFIQYIPISDESVFNSVWSMMQSDTSALGTGFNMEILDDTDGSLYTQWKANEDIAKA